MEKTKLFLWMMLVFFIGCLVGLVVGHVIIIYDGWILPGDCPVTVCSECVSVVCPEMKCPDCVCKSEIPVLEELPVSTLLPLEKKQLEVQAMSVLKDSECYRDAQFDLLPVKEEYKVVLAQTKDVNGPVMDDGRFAKAWVVTVVTQGKAEITRVSSGKMVIDLDEGAVACALPDYVFDWDKEFGED